MLAWLFVAGGLLAQAQPTMTVQFAPAVNGVALDQSPFDGLADAIDQTQGMTVGLEEGVVEFRGIIEFDLSPLGSGDRIESAILEIIPLGSAIPAGLPSVPIHLSGFVGDGSLQTGDFQTGPLLATFEGLTTLAVPISLDVTSFVQRVSSLRFLGFNLKTTANGAQVTFGSLAIGSAPRLTIKLKPVRIDIKPESAVNSLNPRSNGVISVAVLSIGTFDAQTLDPSTIRFGSTGVEAAPLRAKFEDVDGNDRRDLLLHFRTNQTAFVCGSVNGSLSGFTYTRQPINGSDSIRIVGCK